MGISKKSKAVESRSITEPHVAKKKDEAEPVLDSADEIESLDDVSTDNFSSSDDSDDEVVLNRSGNVPSNWYEDEEHRGYDVYGRKVMKTLLSSKIDELLKNAENPDRWRTVQDLQNEREVMLTDADIEIIRRLRAGKYPHASISEENYFVEYDDEPHKLHPVRNKEYPKSRFLPSKDETKEIRRLVKLIRAGKLKPTPKKAAGPAVYDIWAQTEEEECRVRGPAPLPAPKMPLPGHAESYRPPAEYLYTEEEKEEWLAGDESTRKSTFIPEAFGCLRRVPFYGAFITERFSRCLDLYNVPRMLKKKMNVNPDSLIPKLPQISDLRPFPSSLSVEYVGHESRVAGVCVNDQWLASVSVDSVRVWDIESGKAICVLETSDAWAATSVAWHPTLPILTVGDDDGIVRFIVFKKILLQNEEVGESVERLMEAPADDKSTWSREKSSPEADILIFNYGCTSAISSISWHHKGNFMAVVSAKSPSKEKSCCVVSVGNKKYVSPLKGKGQVIGSARHVIFHPSKPYLVVAGCSNVGVFDLKSQSRVHTLNANSDTLSSVAVHPCGEGGHIVATSLDSKVIWFDSEIRNKPWKTFRHHTSAVRKVCFHPSAGTTLPLMASVGDDNAAHIVYSKVYEDDANKNPMVVPVKKLAHPAAVKDCQWHPTLPWLFTACDDAVVRLWA
jgi:ribosome biogenesis protein ERB1